MYSAAEHTSRRKLAVFVTVSVELASTTLGRPIFGVDVCGPFHDRIQHVFMRFEVCEFSFRFAGEVHNVQAVVVLFGDSAIARCHFFNVERLDVFGD